MTQVVSAEGIGSSQSHMSFMRELDFIEQTKYGSSTMKKEEKLPKAQLQVLIIKNRALWQKESQATQDGSLGGCGDSGSNRDLDPEAEGEKVQLHKLSKNQRALFQKENQALFQASLQKES